MLIKKQYIIKLQNSLIDKSIPPGKWWRTAKSVSKFKSINTTNTPIKVNGDIFFHPVDKANSIKNYFTSVSNIDSEPDLPDVPPLAPCELSGIVINEQEICDQFQILNISKPAGPDNLKAVFQSLVKSLTILFQKSLNFGVVPGDWKKLYSNTFTTTC